MRPSTLRLEFPFLLAPTIDGVAICSVGITPQTGTAFRTRRDYSDDLISSERNYVLPMEPLSSKPHIVPYSFSLTVRFS